MQGSWEERDPVPPPRGEGGAPGIAPGAGVSVEQGTYKSETREGGGSREAVEKVQNWRMISSLGTALYLLEPETHDSSLMYNSVSEVHW